VAARPKFFFPRATKRTRLVHSASCAWPARRVELLDESQNLLGAHDFAAVKLDGSHSPSLQKSLTLAAIRSQNIKRACEIINIYA
jgi:hypothetical protein